MRNLPKARVARLAECHKKQKAGYNQHASSFPNTHQHPRRKPHRLVKEKLGHRNINSIMVCTHIVEFDEESQNYHHATAKDEKDAGQLIDNEWTYICTTPQNVMMFRKRK